MPFLYSRQGDLGHRGLTPFPPLPPPTAWPAWPAHLSEQKKVPGVKYAKQLPGQTNMAGFLDLGGIMTHAVPALGGQVVLLSP